MSGGRFHTHVGLWLGYTILAIISLYLQRQCADLRLELLNQQKASSRGYEALRDRLEVLEAWHRPGIKWTRADSAAIYFRKPAPPDVVFYPTLSDTAVTP